MTLSFKRKSKSKKVYNRNKTRSKSRRKNKYSNKKKVNKRVTRKVTRKYKGGMDQPLRKKILLTTDKTEAEAERVRLEAEAERVRLEAEAERVRLEAEEQKEKARLQINALPNLKSQKSSLPNSANVVGPDYEYSDIIEAIREKYKDTGELQLINNLIDQRQGKLRAADGSINFLEFPNAENGHVPPRTVPIGILLKFVVVKDTTKRYRLLYSVAHYPHVTRIEWFIKKYFDNGLNFLGWPGRNVVLITPDMLSKIDNELMPITRFGVLATKTFISSFNVENFIIEYLIRNIIVTDIQTGGIRPFNPTKDSFIIESTELAHSNLPVNSNIPNLEKNENDENIVFSASEGAVFSNGTLELDTSSGHYRPENKQVIIVNVPLLELKGYTDLKVLVPPPDKPHYRAYITNADIRQTRAFINNTYNKLAYDAARQLLSSVKYIDPENELTRENQINMASQEEDFV